MLAIKNSLDWASVENELARLGNMFPNFKHDTVRIIKHLREEVTTLSKLEVDHRNKKSTATMGSIQRQTDKINQELKKIEQIHLMALLTKG